MAVPMYRLCYLVAVLVQLSSGNLFLSNSSAPDDEMQKASNTKPMLCIIEETTAVLFNPNTLQDALDAVSRRFPQAANFSVNRIFLSTENVFDFVKQGCDTLSPTCSAVVSMASCPIVTALNEWTEKHTIPHLIYYIDLDTICQVSSMYNIQLVPAGQIKSNVIELLIQKVWRWKELVLIYDDTFDLKDLCRLQLVLSSISVSTSVFRLDGLSDMLVEDLMNATKKMRRAILAVTSDKLDTIINQASTDDMLGTEYEWIVMSDTTCVNALNKTVLQGSNVLYLSQTHIIRTASHGFCEVAEDRLSHNDNQVHLLSSGLEAFMRPIILEGLPENLGKNESICNGMLENKRRKIVRNARGSIVQTGAGKVMFDRATGKVSSYGFELCSTDDTSYNGYGLVGSWYFVKGLESESSLFRNAFHDFGGMKLLIGGQEAPPFIMKKQEGNETSYVGFSIELLIELANRLNFSYEIVEPPDKLWGAPDDNGTWNGVVGMVTRGEVEFGVGPLTITAIRETVIDFTIPYYEDGIGILTKRPELDSRAMFRLFTPLQEICCHSSSNSTTANTVSKTYKSLMPTAHTHIAHTTLPTSTDFHPLCSSGRFVLGFWWLFTIILVSTYTANMAAVLTITIYEKPINSLTELASQSDMEPLVKESSNIHTLFKEATNEIYVAIWQMMGQMPLVKNNDEALNYVRSGDTAYMTDRSQLEYIVLNDCETYALADDVFNTGGMGFVVPENAPFLESFNLIIMKLQESGILDGWRRQWWSSDGSKCSSNDRFSTVKQLDLQYIAGPFFIFLGALAFSMILVLAEKFCQSDRCKQIKGWILKSNSLSFLPKDT